MTNTPPTLLEAAELHDRWLVEMKRAPRSTRDAQRGAYNTFARWIEGRGPVFVILASPLDWTASNITAHFREVVSKQSVNTWNAKRSQFASAERWMMKEKIIPWGEPIVMSEIPAHEERARPRDRRLNDKQFLDLLKVTGHANFYFLFLFLRLTGRRIGEARAMRWADVLWDEDVILWDNAKAKRYGVRMPLTPELRAALEAWRNVYRAETRMQELRPNWYLFPALQTAGESRRGRPRPRPLVPEVPMSTSAASQAIDEALRAAGLKLRDGDAYHILRKTQVNHTRQSARDSGRADAMDLAQKAADHADARTTQIYINQSEEYDRYHDYAMGATQLGAAAHAAIPALAHLAVPVAHTPTEALDARETGLVACDAEVIDFASRLRRRALA